MGRASVPPKVSLLLVQMLYVIRVPLGNRFRQWATAGRPLVQVNWQRRAPRHLLYANSEIVRRKSDNARPFTDVPYPPHDSLCMGGLPAWAIQVSRCLY